MSEKLQLRSHLGKLLDGMLQSAEKDKQVYVRKSFAIGMLAFYVREMVLEHREFGPWLKANIPEHCREDSVTKKFKASASLSGHMSFFKDTVENAGLTLTPILERLHNSHSGKFPVLGICESILVADATVPPVLQPVQKKLSAFVGDQSKRQLVQRYRQCDEDGNPKIGRRKGEGGASREQRMAHRQKLREMSLAEKRAAMQNCGAACDQCFDELITDPELREEFNDLFARVENLYRFMKGHQA